MRGKRATVHSPAAVAGSDVVEGMLERGRRFLVGVLWLPRFPAFRLTRPQLQLCLRLHQPIERE